MQKKTIRHSQTWAGRRLPTSPANLQHQKRPETSNGRPKSVDKTNFSTHATYKPNQYIQEVIVPSTATEHHYLSEIVNLQKISGKKVFYTQSSMIKNLIQENKRLRVDNSNISQAIAQKNQLIAQLTSLKHPITQKMLTETEETPTDIVPEPLVFILDINMFRNIIQASELNALLQSQTKVYILDASYNIPGVQGNPLSEHFNRRLPGAKFFEIDTIADTSSPYPHMMPSNELFVNYMQRLRIKNDNNLLVCYDRLGNISAPRAWFTFQAFGRHNTAVLDGGLPKWLEAGYELQSGEYEIYEDPSSENPTEYNYAKNENLIIDYDTVRAISSLIQKHGVRFPYEIVDARPEPRFLGEAAEPRPECRSGNIEGSKNLFFRRLFREDGTFRSREEIQQLMQERGISIDDSVTSVHSCGSGLTACINILALHIVNKENCILYDGSWTEYGQIPLGELSERSKKLIQDYEGRFIS